MNEDSFRLGDDDGDTKTAFNSSIDIIQRISRMEYSLASCFITDDLSGAYEILLLIHSEIDFKLKQEERDELENYEDELRDKLPFANEKFNYNGKIFLTKPKIREEVKRDLIELKKVLGRLKYKIGLGMIDANDPSKALLNG